MKQKLRSLSSKILVAAMLFGLLSGCSGDTNGEETGDSQGSGSSDTTATTTEDRMKISYWDSFCENMLPDSYTESLIEAKFPVDIVVNRSSDTNMIQVSALFTEEKVPDVFWTKESSAYINSLGITRTIPREMVEEYAPSFLALYDSCPTIYSSVMDFDNTDEFFALNGATDQAAGVAGSMFADFYRYDWIEALGIDLGVEVTQISDNFYVAHNGPTLEKFEEIMEGFTYGDPDGTGIDDTLGASFEYSNSLNRFELIYSGFDMVAGVNEFHGQAEQFYAMDNYKEFAIWFADLYAKGYIDEDFIDQDRTERWEKVNEEKVGYFPESSIAVNSWAFGRPPLSLLELNPEATFLITPGLSNNQGQGTMIKSAMPTFGALCYVSKHVDDEKLAMILQVLEYTNFGEDNISMWYGEEGVDWVSNEEGGVEVLNNLEVSEKGARVFTMNVQIGELFEAISVGPVFAAGADFWLYDCIWRENDREQYQYKLDLYGETEYNEMEALYGNDCTAIYRKYFEDWVYNGLDVEESWDAMLQELDEAGYHSMMDELNQVAPLEEMILNFTA